MRKIAMAVMLLFLGGCATPEANDDARLGLRCPKCHEAAVVPVLTGFLGPEGVAAIERGDAVAGGCMVGGPTHYCRSCGHEHH